MASTRRKFFAADSESPCPRLGTPSACKLVHFLILMLADPSADLVSVGRPERYKCMQSSNFYD